MAGGKNKIKEQPNHNSKGFHKCPENINKSGANRKLVSDVILKLKSQGYGETNKQEITSVYLTLINVDRTELIEMSTDLEQPILVQIIATELLAGKGFEIIEKMLDRSIGKAEQKTDITSGGVPLGVDPFKQIRENAGINETDQ